MAKLDSATETMDWVTSGLDGLGCLREMPPIVVGSEHKGELLVLTPSMDIGGQLGRTLLKGADTEVCGDKRELTEDPNQLAPSLARVEVQCPGVCTASGDMLGVSASLWHSGVLFWRSILETVGTRESTRLK